ncbi:MAG: phosphoribosylformylglycinamidine synthase subunit PurS [Elusimicrobia bacterium]|nr:phosphoribosylformylglycinamidine synthase subunit PurS [Elusimicrobiota bacterium]
MTKTNGKDQGNLLIQSRGNGKTAGAATYVVEVASKLGFNDAPGIALLGQMPSIGVCGAREVRVSSLYEITGRLSHSQMDILGRGLLCDPITQEFRLDLSASSSAFLIGPHWRVEVWFRPQVTDPVGESVCKAVADMGLPEPDGVRTGTAYQFVGRITQSQIEKVVAKLLANPVIHRTKVAQL